MVRVLVVGAGPAGLSVASSILERNPAIHVHVVDKKPKAGAPPQRCAGGVSTFGLFDEVEKFGVEFSPILAKVTCFRLYAPSMSFWDFKSKEVVGYVLDREIFEAKMAEKAKKLGAEFIWDHTVTKESLSKLKGNYDHIVGCDGYPSIVSDWVGATKPRLYDIEHCIQKVVEIKTHPQDRIDFYFGKVFAPLGYAWVFPKGNNEVRIGLGISLSLRKNVKAFLDFFSYMVAYDLEDRELISRLLPVGPPRRTNLFMGGKVLLVGNAGLCVDPAFGGGILQSIWAGRMCGIAIGEGKPHNYDKYAHWLTKQNRRRYRIKTVLNSLSDKEWNEILEKLNHDKPSFQFSSGGNLGKIARWLFRKKPSLLFRYIRS